jgi:hypothetical protein
VTTQLQGDDDCRYTMNISRGARDRLNELAGQFKITQGEVVEVLLARCDTSAHADAFKKARQDKLAVRAQKRAELAELRKLPPDKLHQLVQQAGKP